MNVAALLHDSPSDDHRRRRDRDRDRDVVPADPPPPPPPSAPPSHTPPQVHSLPHDRPRDRERDRERDRILPSPRQQQLPPAPPPHVSPVLHRHARPPSPQGAHPGSYPYPSQEHPPPRGPHLPPPSAFMSEPYELKHTQRRPNPEGLQHAHELASHGPGSMVPPGAQAYILDHRQTNSLPSRGPPPPPLIHQQHHSRSLSLQQHPHHAHPQPSSILMPPPSRPPHSSSGPPKLASPTGPGIAPPGSGLAHTHITSQGNIPLFPTPAASNQNRARSPQFDHPGMYPGPPRVRSGFDLRSEAESPAMGSLPPPSAYDDRMREREAAWEQQRERERDMQRERELQRGRERDRERERERESGPAGRGPRGLAPSASPRSGSALSSTATGSGAAPTTTARPQPPNNTMLSGPGAAGVINSGPPMGSLLRERDRERERERAAAAAGGASPESRRDRDRDRAMAKEAERDEKRVRERDREREREREKEREYIRQQREREEFRPLDGYAPADLADVEREREWRRHAQAQAQAQAQAREQGHQQVWPRFANQRAVDDERPFLRDAEREREFIDRERQRDFYEAEVRMQDARMQEARMQEAREAEWEAEKARAASRPRTGGKEKEMREREKEERRTVRPPREELDAVRERDQTWAKVIERDQRDAERAQREREREREREEADLRAARQGATQPNHHHHHLHHHHSSSSSLSGTGGPLPLGPKPSKGASGGPSIPIMPQPVGPGIPPNDLPPQYGSMIHDRQQQAGPPFRQGSAKMPNGPGGPSSLGQVILPHPHQHPHQHQHQHPQHPPSNPHIHPHSHSHPHLAAAALGFPHRRTPPAGFPGPIPTSTSAPPGSSLYLHQRTPSPRPAFVPTLPTLHLGTFVYPRTPFPFTGFPPPGADASELRDIYAVLLLPSGFIPTVRPRHPRLWGGGAVPALPPAPAVFARPHPLDARRPRRVYTDDSDVFLCALHAGLLSWSGAQRARGAGRDLRIEVRITREARFVGGLGARHVRRAPDDEAGAEDDGRGLLSAGWGNAHDGAGIEIVSAEFIEPGTARSVGLRNRTQRLREYAARRCALSPEPAHPKKRRRLLSNPLLELAEIAIKSEVEREDAERANAKTVTFGCGKKWPDPWFKYHPSALHEALTSVNTRKPPPTSRKRTRADTETDAADDPEPDKPRAILVETSTEKFLISVIDKPPHSLPADKENVADESAAIGDVPPKTRHFAIALLEPDKEDSLLEEQAQPTDITSLAGISKVLQRDVPTADIQCREDGITVLNSEVDNGLRKGLKIEARRWKWT